MTRFLLLLTSLFLLPSALAATGEGSYGLTSPPNILDPTSPQAEEIEGLFWLVVGFSVFVMIIVVAFMAAGIGYGIRNRDIHSDEEPPQTHGNLKLEVAWTVIPLIILAILLVPTLASIYDLDALSAPDDAIEINVVGQQFWWEMAYLDEEVVTANELVVPTGRAVKINLASSDVMHSFWLPQMAGKVDLVPGNKRTLYFTAEKEGVFYGQCAELCGDSHANMRLRVVSLSPEEYSTWTAAAKQPATVVTQVSAQGPQVQEGSQLFISKGCVNCHAVQGVNTYNRVGPDLSHIGSRTSIAAGMLQNTPENMVRWLRYTDTVKPGVAMPNLGLNQEEAEALTAYLETLTLPDVDMQSMIDLEEADTNDATIQLTARGDR